MKNSIQLYADFNCPYCFALSERINALYPEENIEWRYIQHNPFITKGSFSQHDQIELTAEVNDVRKRAQEVPIHLPDYRPNSHLASQWVAQLSMLDKTQGDQLRKEIFRALWFECRDISNPEVLNNILAQLGLEKVTIHEKTKQLLEEWQYAWENGQYARNLPALESYGGGKILGFPPLLQLKSFLLENKTKVLENDFAACIMAPKPNILLLGGQAPGLNTSLKTVQNECHVKHCQDIRQLLADIDNNFPAELIILAESFSGSELLRHLIEIKSKTRIPAVPIVVISDNPDEQLQIAAFNEGVSEYLVLPLNEKIILHRINAQMRYQRTLYILDKLARIDGLTELSNRRDFDYNFSREWERAIREKTSIALLMIDIDFFKNYNDSYGHCRGDSCLKQVAQIINACIHRPTDIVARYGGEEFAIILPNTEEKGAQAIAEVIFKQIRVHEIEHDSSSVEKHITLSIGISSSIPHFQLGKEALLNRADQALYDSKQKGRNIISYLPL